MLKKLICTLTCSILFLNIPLYSVANDAVSQPCVVRYYSDKDKNNEINIFDLVDRNSEVYYDIICADGFVCRSASVCADYADNEKIIFGNSEISEIIPEYGMTGDVNLSESVNLDDVSMILKHIAGYTFAGKYNGRVSDFNGDGKINLSDCSQMLKKIAKWDNADPYCGVSDDFRMYCNVDNSVSVVIQHDAINKMTGKRSISVITDSGELEKYITDSPDGYKMNNNDSAYSSEYIRNTYDDVFFSENDLVILDVEAPLFMNEKGNIIKTERNGEDKLNIVFYNNYGASGTKTSVAHCLISISKSVNVSENSISVLRRFTTSPTFDDLYEYTENIESLE